MLFYGSQCSSCLLFVLWPLTDLKWTWQCCCWWCCHRCGCGCCEQQMMLGASEATAHPRTAKPGLRGGIPVCPSHSPMADLPGLAPQLSKWLSSQMRILSRAALETSQSFWGREPFATFLLVAGKVTLDQLSSRLCWIRVCEEHLVCDVGDES